SMITPPLSISAMPRLTRAVPVTGVSDTIRSYPGRPPAPTANRQPVAWLVAGPATPLRSRRRVEHRVVDVEVLRRRVPPGQPEQPDQRAAAHRQRVAYRVVVHLPGQRDPPAGLDDAVERLGHRYLPQLPGEVVLGQLAVLGY